MGGYDFQILWSKAYYAALQLGIFIVNEIEENYKVLDRMDKQQLEWAKEQSGYFEPTYCEFKCFYGVRLDPNSLWTDIKA